LLVWNRNRNWNRNEDEGWRGREELTLEMETQIELELFVACTNARLSCVCVQRVVTAHEATRFDME
jgi:hypothetical protein